jgi:hypothetical protein
MIDLVYICYLQNLIRQRRQFELAQDCRLTANRRFVAIALGAAPSVKVGVARKRPATRQSILRRR